ncbi:YdeI/OmpD-associated family protein [Agrilutibacter solisilvae]|uniref:YdeI/OmpD-associated family protein n=1 Tax=Agrilutibacter solisilvae TaxID=2763317 RepID=A0A974XYU3_9GAMM|nr:YdeI/OmpD-associated family protein [Lysobacter solisilvae]QSX78148.1 YdeI/OmpD-associated family protein [Lysobacter solisilvae]
MGARDPRVDDYIGQAAEFARPILEYVRERAHWACPECSEALKWGMPSFLYRGKILCSTAAFRQHASVALWRAGPATGAGAAKREGMGQFGRLTSVRDLPGKREFATLLRQAMARVDAGVPGRPKSARAPLTVPADLASALAGNAQARMHFDAFPPSARRDYVEWIIEARQSATRQRRLAQSVEWLAQGKRRHWKYERAPGS